MKRAKPTPSPDTAEFEALAKMLNFSVLLLDRDTNLKFASANAHTLFESADHEEFKRGWRDCYGRLKLPDLLSLEKNSKPLRHRTELRTVKSTRLLRIEVYPLRHGDCECYVLLLKELQILNDLEQQLMLASHHNLQRYVTSALVHDLNAPVNTMRITLELVERTVSSAAVGAPSDFVTKWGRYKGIFREELAKLKAQVADIPNLLSSAKSVTPVVFDIRGVIEDVARFVKHETTSKQIRRDLVLPDYPLTIHGRRIDLRLALLNLACGLVEATKQGGCLHVHAFSTEGFAEIVLRADQGQVTQQDLDDYEQLAFVPKGSGGGLFIARLIVEAHGGEVHVDSLGGSHSASIRVMLPLYIDPSSVKITCAS